MKIGLTGGIGSGKSVVAKIFRLLGAEIFNSDEAAKNQYSKNEIKNQVIHLLGNEAYDIEGNPNRKYIASKIFSDTDLLKLLNSIIHPAVKSDFELFCKKHSHKLIIKESAILFETGLYKELDSTILVTAPAELKIARVMKRDNITENEVVLRMKNQLNDEEKIKKADFIIYNNEKLFLTEQCLSIYDKLIALEKK